MLKVIVADGHPTTRFGIREALCSSRSVEVMGECDTGEEALLLAEAKKPDVVVLGLNLLEEMGSVSTCEEIKALPDPPYLLVHSAYDFTDDICSCLLEDVDGYLHKRAPCEEFVEAVVKVGGGERVWQVGEKLEECPDELRQASTKMPMSEKLTSREREVLALMLGRRSGSEIARKLCIGTEMIKTHTRRIFRKLGVSSRSELFSPDQR
ncbi:MAG: response regulator transcription factor [Rubrobacteraceae bacterium]